MPYESVLGSVYELTDASGFFFRLSLTNIPVICLAL